MLMEMAKRPKFYPPLWFLCNLLAIFGIAWLRPSGSAGEGWWDFPGQVIAFGGALIALLGARAFLMGKTSIVPYRKPARLLTGGIFRYTRNPVYAGEALILAGIALRLGDPLLFAVPLVFWWGMDRCVVFWEERLLRREFGGEFEAYCGRTRRWI